MALAVSCPRSWGHWKAFNFSTCRKLLGRLPEGFYTIGGAVFPASDRLRTPCLGAAFTNSQGSACFCQSYRRVAIEHGVWDHCECNCLHASANVVRSNPTRGREQELVSEPSSGRDKNLWGCRHCESKPCVWRCFVHCVGREDVGGSVALNGDSSPTVFENRSCRRVAS